MNKMNHTKTPVKFFKEEDGSLLAVFPTVPHNQELDNVVCYSPVDGHSVCSKEYYSSLSLAQYPEYRYLLTDLITLGYNLSVLRG